MQLHIMHVVSSQRLCVSIQEWSSTEMAVGFLLVGVIWTFNQYLISSGMLTRALSNDVDPEEGDDDDSTTEQRLALTYGAIYGSTERYTESESTRTWLWLIFALLLNVVCFRIELLLLEDVMGSN